MNVLPRLGCFAVTIGFALGAAACDPPCDSCPQQTCIAEEEPSNWIFQRSTYTHDPQTGARVAQYQRLPAIEPLEDERLVTSRYHRTQTNLRGTNGSTESYYEVQSWGNGRGGIDAEWERFHNAWKESYLQNGYYNQGPGYGYPNQFGYGGFGGAGYGYGNPGYGFPGNGYGGPWGGNQGQWHGNHGHGNHDDDGHDDGHGNGHPGDWD